jgi:hypothetical protein
VGPLPGVQSQFPELFRRDRVRWKENFDCYFGERNVTGSHLVDRLIERGLVVRRRSEKDRRTVEIELSAVGKRLKNKSQNRSSDLLFHGSSSVWRFSGRSPRCFFWRPGGSIHRLPLCTSSVGCRPWFTRRRIVSATTYSPQSDLAPSPTRGHRRGKLARLPARWLRLAPDRNSCGRRSGRQSRARSLHHYPATGKENAFRNRPLDPQQGRLFPLTRDLGSDEGTVFLLGRFRRWLWIVHEGVGRSLKQHG